MKYESDRRSSLSLICAHSSREERLSRLYVTRLYLLAQDGTCLKTDMEIEKRRERRR